MAEQPGPMAAFNCFVTTPHMSPAYEEGDDIKVNPALPLLDGNDVLLVSVPTDDAPARATLRRLIQKTDTHWVVKQWNPEKVEELDRQVWTAFRVESVKRRN